VYSVGLLRFPDTAQTNTVRIVGLRLDEVYEVNAFKSSLYYERFYPGTTTLGQQREPVLGLDYDAPPIPLGDGRGFPRPLLPEPYKSALEAARERALRETGAPLDDPDTVDNELNDILRRGGMPIIPGNFRLNLDTAAAGLEGDPLPGVILGRDLIAKRESDGRYYRYEQYTKGMKVTLTLWATSAGGNVDPIPIRRVFRYADDSRTGIYDIDSQHVYVDFDLLQQILEMNAAEREDGGRVYARCSQIQIKVSESVPEDRLKDLCRRMEASYKSLLDSGAYDLSLTERRLLERVQVLTWRESQAHIFGPVQKEKMLVTMLFGIISLVAVALILCILYMIVLQKTRDIGIVKSVGGSSVGVAAIFLFYGAAVGLVGGVLGTIGGTLFVHYINEIQDFLIYLNPSWRVWDLEVYSFDRIPSEVHLADQLTIAITSVLASTLGSLAAAWRAGSMHPVEALRYE
ncbi:MAG: ABC transporter permease, partial [Planctomycetota bacterium]